MDTRKYVFCLFSLLDTWCSWAILDYPDYMLWDDYVDDANNTYMCLARERYVQNRVLSTDIMDYTFRWGENFLCCISDVV